MSEACMMTLDGAIGVDAADAANEHARTAGPPLNADAARDERRRRLVALTRQVINLEYPNDKAFAKAAGVSQQYLSALLQGKINVPSAKNRRSLARALHMSHVELLMLMGELEPDEVDAADDVRGGVDADTFAVLRLYRRIDDQQRGLILRTMQNFVRDDARRQALS